MEEDGTGNDAGGDAQDQNDRIRHQFDWTGDASSRTTSSAAITRSSSGWLSEWETQGFTDFGFLDDLG